MTQKNSKQQYFMEGSRIQFAPYDGRRKFPHNDLNNEICGAIHCARKDLDGECGWCRKQIKKGQLYVQKGRTFMYTELARVHLECDNLDNKKGRLYVIKRVSGVLDKNICKRIFLKDIPTLRKNRKCQ